MAKKQKQPEKTCADCIHENACRVWTEGREISDAVASICPRHETVKESGAYLCGVLDERKRKQTNADRIRAMSDDALAEFIMLSPEMEFRVCECCEVFRGHGAYTPCGTEDGWCRAEIRCNAFKKWLKQPAVED